MGTTFQKLFQLPRSARKAGIQYLASRHFAPTARMAIAFRVATNMVSLWDARASNIQLLLRLPADRNDGIQHL